MSVEIGPNLTGLLTLVVLAVFMIVLNKVIR